MNSKQIFKVALVFSLFLTACGAEEEEASNKPTGPMNVEVYQVVAEPFSNEVVATANLLANENVALMAPVAGQVLEIFFKEGQYVQQGARIVRLDDRAWKYQLTGLETQLDVAKKKYERKKSLLSIEGVSPQEMEELNSTIQTLQSQIDNLKLSISLANIRAPFSGTLGMRDFSVGAYLKVGDPITTLTDRKHLKVNFAIPQEYISSIKVNQMVHVLVKNDTLDAKVYAISPSIDATSATIQIRAALDLDPSYQIIPGMYAEVLVSTDFNGSALMVPTQAIVPSISDQTVYVVKNGVAKRNVVVTGSRNADKANILSGISEGDMVVTTGLMSLKDGAKVNILNVKK